MSAELSAARAAVIGHPIAHSRSPEIFAYIAAALGCPGFRYEALDVDPGQLTQLLARLRSEPGWVGVNVTIPHKESVLRLLDEASSEARTVGAVNVVRAEGGTLTGFNTDVVGFLRALEDEACRVEGSVAWIYGAGGAGRAVAFALASRGARCVYLKNRAPERAAKIRDELGALYPATCFIVAAADGAEPEPLNLVVNTTPLGMRGAAAPGDFFEGLRGLPCRRDALAYDLIYNPEHTPFIRLAEEHGLRTASGLGMLVHQALASWERWQGAPLGNAGLRLGLSRHLRERPIFLTGFMGVGKSVTAREMARRLGWEALDTDAAIVSKAGIPIPKIFELRGEAEFRALEKEAVFAAAARRRVVVSLGGGALTNPECLAEVERTGTLVCLDASLEKLEQRLSSPASTRPLLAGLGEKDRLEKIRTLHEARRPVYERASVRVPTDGLGQDQVAELALRRLFGARGLAELIGRTA